MCNANFLPFMNMYHLWYTNNCFHIVTISDHVIPYVNVIEFFVSNLGQFRQINICIRNSRFRKLLIFSNNAGNFDSLWEMNPNMIIHFNLKPVFAWQNNRSHHGGGTMHSNLIDSSNCIIMQITSRINCDFSATWKCCNVQWRSNNWCCFGIWNNSQDFQSNDQLWR